MGQWCSRQLAGDHANQDRDLVHEEAIAASDKDTQVLQRFLAERVALLFSYDKDQGPQVFFFEGEVATLSKNSRPTRLCRKTLSKSHKKSQRTSPVAAEQGPNKRELFRAAVGNPPLGHAWAWTSERENGGRIKCTRCQPEVQQFTQSKAYASAALLGTAAKSFSISFGAVIPLMTCSMRESIRAAPDANVRNTRVLM